MAGALPGMIRDQSRQIYQQVIADLKEDGAQGHSGLYGNRPAA
jgi:aspartate/glutamate racemase